MDTYADEDDGLVIGIASVDPIEREVLAALLWLEIGCQAVLSERVTDLLLADVLHGVIQGDTGRGGEDTTLILVMAKSVSDLEADRSWAQLQRPVNATVLIEEVKAMLAVRNGPVQATPNQK